MPVTKYASTKRYGARYGRSIKEKLGKIEEQRRKDHSCPYCNRAAVERKSYGLWHCRHCNSEFTGYAYSISRSVAVEEKDHAILEVTKQRVKEAPLPDEE